MKRIAVFASGAGSNARVLIQHFENHPDAQVTLLVTNRPECGAAAIAMEHGVEVLYLDRDNFYGKGSVANDLIERGIDLIVLAGFLWRVPADLISPFENRIINLHPSLLPKFGGRGMYGNNVHKAVIEAGEKESGITIHYVTEEFDEGAAIAQFSCPVFPSDNIETLAKRIHELEHKHLAPTVDKLLFSL